MCIRDRRMAEPLDAADGHEQAHEDRTDAAVLPPRDLLIEPVSYTHLAREQHRVGGGHHTVTVEVAKQILRLPAHGALTCLLYTSAVHRKR